MKVFCDTNVLVAAFIASHAHHHAARPVLERIKAGENVGFIAAHSLAEVYAVLTRLPNPGPVPPSVAWELINENVIKNFAVVNLTARDYSTAIERTARNGVIGGQVYDALLLAAAAKSGAERIYSFNVGHFQNLADEALQKLIAAP